MDTTLAFNVLSVLTTSLGILIGFLLIFMQFIPERKRRIVDIYRGKLLDVTINSSSPTQITNEEEIIRTKFEELLKQNIIIKILGKDYSLITLNLIVFIYTILLFIFSLICLFLMIYDNTIFGYGYIYCLLALTIIAYLLLIPVSIWCCVKDFELK